MAQHYTTFARALPAETKVGSGTSRSKSGTSFNLSDGGNWRRPCPTKRSGQNEGFPDKPPCFRRSVKNIRRSKPLTLDPKCAQVYAVTYDGSDEVWSGNQSPLSLLLDCRSRALPTETKVERGVEVKTEHLLT
jgi:hypothetical protein